MALIVGTCGLASCAPSAVPGEEPVAAVSPGPTPRLGNGVVRVALNAAPMRLGLPPLYVVDPIGRAERTINNLVMAQLVKLSATGRAEADLAETVPTIGNGGARFEGDGADRRLITTFRLRPNARWNDGQPITSADLVFTWQLARRPSTEGLVVDAAHRIERVSVIDERTVAFTYYSQNSARAAAIGAPNRFGFLREQIGPSLDFRYSHGLPGWWIYPRHVLAGGSDDEAFDALLARTGFDRRPVGAGPYAIERFGTDEIRLRSRPDYHGGTPTFPTLIARSAEPSERAIGLVNGQFDVAVFHGDEAATGVGFQRAQGLIVDGPLASDDEEILRFNTGSAALRDPRVRRGILHAIDRRALALDRFTDRAAAAALIDDGIGAVTRNDPERARQLLREGGWQISATAAPVGLDRSRLRLLTTSDPARSRQATLIEAALAPFGVNVTTTRLNPGSLFAPDGPIERGAFDLAIYGVSATDDPVGDTLDRLTAESAKRPDPRLAGLRERADRTHDPSERQALLVELDALMVERAFEARLYVYPRAVVRTSALVGPVAAGSGIGVTWNAARWARG